jgi:transcription initiation factor IIE alpha subunit
MDDVTCPNCNVDASVDELKRSRLRCPTCGFDLSDRDQDGDEDDTDEDNE